MALRSRHGLCRLPASGDLTRRRELYQLDPRGTNTPPGRKPCNIELGTKWNLLDNRLAPRAFRFPVRETNERNTDG